MALGCKRISMIIKPIITSSALVLSRVFGIDEKLETEPSTHIHKSSSFLNPGTRVTKYGALHILFHDSL